VSSTTIEKPAEGAPKAARGGRRKAASAAQEQYLTKWHLIEDFIRSYSFGGPIQYTFFPAQPLSSVDVEDSLRNQARIDEGALDQGLVDQYALAIEAGNELPPTIVWDRNGGFKRMLVVDGNHRQASAAQAGRSEWPMFVLAKDTKPAIVQLMTMEANVAHGRATNERTRAQHALHMVLQGASVALAAKRFNVPEGAVTKLKAEDAARRRATRVGIDDPVWEAIPATSQARLGGVATDEIFGAAVGLVHDGGLDARQIGDLVSRLNATRSVKEQEVILERARMDEFAEQITAKRTTGVVGTEKGRAKGGTDRQKWGRAMGAVGALPPVRGVLSVMTPLEQTGFGRRLAVDVQQLIEALAVVMQETASFGGGGDGGRRLAEALEIVKAAAASFGGGGGRS
jgi:hypothetical protein